MKKTDAEIRQSEYYSEYQANTEAQLNERLFYIKAALATGSMPDFVEEEIKEELTALKLVKKDRLLQTEAPEKTTIEKEQALLNKILTKIEDTASIDYEKSLFQEAITSAGELYNSWLIGRMLIENWKQIARFNKAMAAICCLEYVFNNDLASNIELMDSEEIIELFPHLASTVEEYQQINNDSSIKI